MDIRVVDVSEQTLNGIGSLLTPSKWPVPSADE